ncbi:AAA family ATPase [Halobacillus yeomjeoni]|uniref:Nuclease SbcCD subunit C n=1 Tax=Halobacillus yeomjeoni TaxID=311194 RepID=A0A931HU93_9BACI|nr:SMC family ATPase [Halobacillus yeomjeoni]MBH0229508.1 SMC family ATPase [Halobacillus yeomjeoni]
MRALALTMNAFGPYRLKQTIDFTILGEESIFLITGPTGAGKTTIFDAMCFALYGRASGSDRDQDTMRSHFADPGETTYVDFQFELRGKPYRIVRMPKQVRKKERGEGWKEDPARAELYLIQGDEEKLIASKIKEVNDYIEEIMSLDYEQFRKMIMIPQGEFRKLISENSKEREEILQRIFKTHFYSELTEHLKQQSKTLEKEINEFQWKIDQAVGRINWGMEVESIDEEPDQVVERLKKRILEQKNLLNEENEHLRELNEKNEKIQEVYHAAKNMHEQFQERDELKKEAVRLQEKEKDISVIEEEMKWAKKAADIRPYEKQWQERKQEFERLKVSQQKKEERRKEKESEFHNVQEKYLQEEKRDSERKKLEEQWTKKLEEQQKLQEFTSLQQQFEKLNGDLQEKECNLAHLKNHYQELTNEKEKWKHEIKDERHVTNDLMEHKTQLDQLNQTLDKVKTLSQEWLTLQDMRNTYQRFMKKFRTIENHYQESKKKYESALEEIRSHHAYTLSVQLEEGSPCPVCGSSHHPEPAGKPGHVAGQKELEQLKQAFEQADTDYQKARNEAVDVKTKGETQRRVTDSLYKELASLVEELDEKSIDQAIHTLREQSSAVEKKMTELRNKAQHIDTAYKKLDEIEKEINEYNQKIETSQKSVYEKQQKLIELKTKLNTFKENHSFETIDEGQLNKEVNVAERNYKEAMKNWETIQKTFMQARDDLQQAKVSEEESQSYLKQTEAALKQREKEFKQTFDQYGFSSMETYKEALLSSESMNEKQTMIDQYKQKVAVVNERLQLLESKLKDQPKPDLEDILKKWEETKGNLHTQQQIVNDMNVAVKQNEEVRITMQELLREQGDLAKQYYDIAELANLARGDNHLRLSLERYVLAAFLDEILVQANLRFDQMSDHRYQLIRSGEVAKRGAQSGLDLEVLDHHTGQQRSVRTLSGGEGFKASLSLALGMADVVQAHAGGVQLDTLFIDEGFGTLDEISLEQAIDCLRGLQDGNRMLGIISHVSQLKEEIPAKLQIQAGPQGSSVQFVFQ